MKRTESPAKSLFVLTKTLQPVVSKCLFGWPAGNEARNLVYILTVDIFPFTVYTPKLKFNRHDWFTASR